MTDRLALILGLLLVLMFGADFLFNHGDATLFLARKLTELVDYLEFWR
ncbi:hypothetical protein [Acidimangrovimonas sediminis]|nr:hypothetical protein [Acidimangrovimonas sediminis]